MNRNEQTETREATAKGVISAVGASAPASSVVVGGGVANSAPFSAEIRTERLTDGSEVYNVVAHCAGHSLIFAAYDRASALALHDAFDKYVAYVEAPPVRS